MTIQVNGEQVTVEEQSLQDLLEHYKLEPQLVVTEVDGVIIGLEERSNLQIKDGMTIELVHFVGGG
ncbi:sulfur carrier protein ThiS [Alkalicoccobacillus murimartini]|uniref:Sulfur carrier protein n=1 Tax=Alkalicoccobacillus murimartini TaxID=171685 RepID=A0ABT9YDN8_9BACI|nr:sulfur carrier protein ThiS [Alkalicoccobacillus murimartini]MDQ0205605.1 sulfur carrier protein [Alkalicoccobacillus murimartini]